MLIHEAFDKTLKKRLISARALSGLTKVSEAHISQFRNGKGGDVSHTTLERLLDGMEELAPGSRLDFCQMLAGGNLGQPDPDQLVSSMDSKELASLLNAIASRFAQSSPKLETERVAV